MEYIRTVLLTEDFKMGMTLVLAALLFSVPRYVIECFVYHYKYIEVGVGTRPHSSHGGSRIATIRHRRSFVLPLALRSPSVVFACLLVLLPCLPFFVVAG